VLFFWGYSQFGFALTWQDLWLRADNQAYQALQSGQIEKAEKLFTSPIWKSVAQYRQGNFDLAIESLSQDKSPLSYYNQGNAWAALGQYDKAIKSYEAALKQDPNYPDAAYNRDVLKKKLQTQQQQQQKQQQQSQESQSQHPEQEQLQKHSSQTLSQNSQNNSEQDNVKNNAKDNEKQSSNSQDSKQQDKKNQEQANQSQNQSNQNQEQTNQKEQFEEQAPINSEMKKWLKQVPDDPGGLLRHKLYRDYQRRHEAHHLE
jgi:Ca-activated chloride channel homolog